MAPVIKRRSASLHRIAEEAVGTCDPFASRMHYMRYLDRLSGFYDVIEPPLVMWLADVLPDIRRRAEKRLSLRRDLAFLGQRVESLARPRALEIRSRATAMGIAYVLEGKTLGSRFLLAEAKAKLDLDAERGASFFAGYGAETGAMWNAYRATLESFVAHEGRRRAVLDGVFATFHAFTEWVRTTP